MSEEAVILERKYNILVFGIDKLDLPMPTEPLQERNFCLFFENFKTHHRFQEFDGVIIFQGIFERFAHRITSMSSYLHHEYDVDELDMRKKEARLLLRQGGFICFLLNDQFIDKDRGQDYSETDLAKCHLNYPDFYRRNYSDRQTHVIPVLDEFKRFLEVYGAATSYFRQSNETLDLRTLARIEGDSVGLLLNRSEYFVPTLVPSRRLENIIEYFQLLAEAITSVQNKNHVVVPEWVKAYQFHEEKPLIEERIQLLHRVSRIDQRFEQFTTYKSVLVQSGPELVSSVSAILAVTLGTKIDNTDEFREDVKILGDDGSVIAICEIKGINRGIKRENINQTDTHRERSGFSDDFPAILIANTNIKSARSLNEKKHDPDIEQVKHAVKNRILIILTIDLLDLLRLVICGKLTTEAARAHVLSNVGWLRVDGDQIQILSGE